MLSNYTNNFEECIKNCFLFTLNTIIFSFVWSNLAKRKSQKILFLVNLKILPLEVRKTIFSRVHPFCIEMAILESFLTKHNQRILEVNK